MNFLDILNAALTSLLGSKTYSYHIHDPKIQQPVILNDMTDPPGWNDSPSPTATPAPTTTPTTGAYSGPRLSQAALQAAIQQGYNNYNPKAPLATMSAQLAQAGVNMPDQFMPAALGIKESSGGVNMTNTNNDLNILDPRSARPTGRYDPQGNPIMDYAYPSMESSITGQPGDNRSSFQELMKDGPYQQYLQTGNLVDFFKHYTPAYDQNGVRNTNPDYPEQIKTYNTARSNFTK